MILVIPLINKTQSPELRYALRSITTHHDITECILVGGKPDWYTGSHIAHKDYGPIYKEQNIRDKVIAAGVQGEFMFANDDHILLEPLTSTWNKGLLKDCLSLRIGNGSYTRCLRNTFEKYGNVPNVDTHCPMIMDGEMLQRTNFEWPQYGIGFKTCYTQENNLPSVYMEDCKVDKIPIGKPWFSLAENFRVNTLQEIYPQHCKFEKEYLS